jgi:hypothetical protein
MAHPDIIDLISLGGYRDKANDDRAGSAGPHAWVIDGATGLGEPLMGGSSDAAWFAQSFHEALVRHAGEAEPAELLKAAAQDVAVAFVHQRRREPVARWEWPCAAFMMASRIEGGVKLSFAGDCRAILRPDDGPIMAFGATAASEAEEAREAARLADPCADSASRFRSPEALKLLKAQRDAALSPGNPLIPCPDPGFLAHVSHATVMGRRVETLLMTDGFAAAELRYGLFDSAHALFDAVKGQGARAVAAALRDFEERVDPDGRLKPRWKRSDDASCVWGRFSP